MLIAEDPPGACPRAGPLDSGADCVVGMPLAGRPPAWAIAAGDGSGNWATPPRAGPDGSGAACRIACGQDASPPRAPDGEPHVDPLTTCRARGTGGRPAGIEDRGSAMLKTRGPHVAWSEMPERQSPAAARSIVGRAEVGPAP